MSVNSAVRITSLQQAGRCMRSFGLVAAFATSAIFNSVTSIRAQDGEWEGIMYPGQLVVTGFPGTHIPGGEVPPGPEMIDETLIDPARAAVRVLDVSYPQDPPGGQQIDAPTMFEVPVSETGLVFGTALDDLKYPNIYVTATSVFGLHIVLPDADGDTRPERLMNGAPGATFMQGQWGAADPAGGPGSVWKIDGRTGEVSLFANIALDGFANSGAGLGNIAFSSRHGMFYVSDRDTGMIHRLDRDGTDLGTFDHGVAGRGAAGMGARAFDPSSRLDIQDPAFDVNDPATWALPDARRRVWGLAVHGDRLYYAVAAGPQIWSVGLNRDGSFADDPRWEVDVPPAPMPYEVSDIAFDPQGRMILAQRANATGGYDYGLRRGRPGPRHPLHAGKSRRPGHALALDRGGRRIRHRFSRRIAQCQRRRRHQLRLYRRQLSRYRPLRRVPVGHRRAASQSAGARPMQDVLSAARRP